jgi:hypothetical protein
MIKTLHGVQYSKFREYMTQKLDDLGRKRMNYNSEPIDNVMVLAKQYVKKPAPTLILPNYIEGSFEETAVLSQLKTVFDEAERRLDIKKRRQYTKHDISESQSDDGEEEEEEDDFDDDDEDTI